MKYFLKWLVATIYIIIMLVIASLLAFWHWDTKYYEFFGDYRVNYMPWSYGRNRPNNRRYKPTTY